MLLFRFHPTPEQLATTGTEPAPGYEIEAPHDLPSGHAIMLVLLVSSVAWLILGVFLI